MILSKKFGNRNFWYVEWFDSVLTAGHQPSATDNSGTTEVISVRLSASVALPMALYKYVCDMIWYDMIWYDFHPLLTLWNAVRKLTFSNSPPTSLPCCPPSDCQRLWFSIITELVCIIAAWFLVWLSGNTLASINVVALHQTRLVPGWVTVCGRVNHLGM